MAEQMQMRDQDMRLLVALGICVLAGELMTAHQADAAQRKVLIENFTSYG